jgi:hypothetical protein
MKTAHYCVGDFLVCFAVRINAFVLKPVSFLLIVPPIDLGGEL